MTLMQETPAFFTNSFQHSWNPENYSLHTSQKARFGRAAATERGRRGPTGKNRLGSTKRERLHSHNGKQARIHGLSFLRLSQGDGMPATIEIEKTSEGAGAP